jgi:flagellar basal-body rod modification protein FlgD
MSPTPHVTTHSNTQAAGSPADPSTGTAASLSPLSSENTFLTLLVSQLQYQDPLQPVDSTQFVTQLTGYSQLEQLINIDTNTTPAAAAAAKSTTP